MHRLPTLLMCAVSLWLGAASSTYGQAAAQATSTDVIWKNILVLRDKRLANSQQDEQNLNKLLDETQQQLQKLWEYTQQLVVENQRLKGGQGPSRAAAYTGGSLTSNPTTVYAPSIAGTGGGTVMAKAASYAAAAALAWLPASSASAAAELSQEM